MAVELIIHKDRFNGLTLKSNEQNLEDETQFIEQLKVAMEKWKIEDKIRGLWLKVDKSNTTLLPHLINLGFEIHHAQSGYVMLTNWLADNEPNGLPEYANQYIGVGGFVVNDKNELLVIQEKYTMRKLWKLPGGHANTGEELEETARREIFEETGIDTEFVSLLCFRHQHMYRFGCSDIYFVCLMKPIGGEIKPCQQEIDKCQWMDLEEYRKLPDITDVLQYITECYLKISANGNLSITPERVLNFFRNGKDNIYSIGSV